MTIASTYSSTADCVILNTDWRDLLRQLPAESLDLTVTSPPYFLGKSYDTSRDIKDFEEEQRCVLPRVIAATKPGGNICWQVGYHVKRGGTLTPLDFLVHSIFSQFPDVRLRNRLIWTFDSGPHGRRRLSGRHEIVLWYSKGENYYFDVDSIRVPQKYPGKRHHKGKMRGELSGNPRGKNPGDVWPIPNVKAGSVEKTLHPCQFPIGLVQGLILALSPPGALVLDPYLGSGSTAVASVLEKRRFVGSEIDQTFYQLSLDRVRAAIDGRLRYRPYGRPIQPPSGAVAARPAHFRSSS